MARYDDLSTGPIAYAALVSTIVLAVIILLVRALTYSWVETEDAKKLVNAHYVAADTAIAEQRAKIAGYSKAMVEVPPPAGSPADAKPTQEERLHIPVTQAKELLLKEWATKKP